MLQIEVCATSANVCVGFDVLGLALNLKNKFTFEPADAFGFEGFEEKYCNLDNLVVRSYLCLFEKAGKAVLPVKIGFYGNIPVARGLGSSSSLVVAGIFAANHFLNNRFTREELFQFCCELEGHPDNVAPAIYGGLVASYRVNDTYKAIGYRVDPSLCFSIIVPPFEISTEKVRHALPKYLAYSDIVSNLSRIIHLPKAFAEGDLALLQELFEDRLHEPYRGLYIEHFFNIKKQVEALGCAFAISGSGSTMLIISKNAVAQKLKDIPYPIQEVGIGSGVLVKEG